MKTQDDPIEQYLALAGVRSIYPSLAEAAPKTPKLTKKNQAILSNVIQHMLSDAHAVIDMYDLSKLWKAAEDAYMAGGDQEAVKAAIAAAIAKYRVEAAPQEESLASKISWEKKSATVQVAFVDVTSEDSGKALKHEVALRIDGRGGSFRVDMATSVRGSWLPWEAIDNGKAVDSEEAAKQLAAAWVAAANKQKTLHPSAV